MGFRTATPNRVFLKDFEDQVLALRAVRWEQSIPVNLPEDTENGRPATKDHKPALLADIAVLDGSSARHMGQTLIFYPVVADAVQMNSPDWAVGVLRRRQGENYEYFALEDLEGNDFETAVAAFKAIGLE